MQRVCFDDDDARAALMMFGLDAVLDVQAESGGKEGS